MSGCEVIRKINGTITASRDQTRPMKCFSIFSLIKTSDMWFWIICYHLQQNYRFDIENLFSWIFYLEIFHHFHQSPGKSSGIFRVKAFNEALRNCSSVSSTVCLFTVKCVLMLQCVFSKADNLSKTNEKKWEKCNFPIFPFVVGNVNPLNVHEH